MGPHDNGPANELARGSLWRKWDLHVHTPASIVNSYGSDNWDKYFNDLRNLPTELSVIGINDYLFVDGYRRVLREFNAGNLPNIEAILPVIELRLASFTGTDGNIRRINWHVIFEPGMDPDVIEAQFINGLSAQYRLEPGDGLVDPPQWSGFLNVESLKNFGAQIRRGVPEDQQHRYTESDLQLGFNNFNVELSAVANLLDSPLLFGRALTAVGKTEWNSLKWNDQSIATKKHLINSSDVVFTATQSGDLYQKSRKALQDAGLNDRLLDCSDAHHFSTSDDPNRIGESLTWINADPTLAGLKRALVEFDTRIYIGTEPPKLTSQRLRAADHIERIEIAPSPTRPANAATFFSVDVALNPGFVAIVGRKGQGKSALLDALGLATNSHEQSHFSFLNKDRFLNPKTGYGDHYDVKLTWTNWTQSKKRFSARTDLDSAERATYLPQHLLDEICSSDPGAANDKFSERLSSVLFAHVPEERRLGTTNFDALVRTRTSAIDEQIASLRTELGSINSEISQLIRDSRPENIGLLRSQLRDVDQRIADLKRQQPPEPVAPPIPGEDPASGGTLRELRSKRDQLTDDIRRQRATESALTIKADAIDQIVTATDTLRSQYESFVVANSQRAINAEIDLASIVTLTIDRTSLLAVKDAVAADRSVVASLLHPTAGSSLPTQVKALDSSISDLEAELDEPSRKFAEAQKAVETWKQTLADLVDGSPGQQGKSSIEREIQALQEVPQKIVNLTQVRATKVRKIHQSLLAKIEILNDLYRPARDFIAQHDLAIRSGLEFAASLGELGFEDRFWDLVGRNVSGPFAGQIEGSERLRELVDETDFANSDDVVRFTSDLATSVAKNPNGSPNPERTLRKGRTLEELLDLIFGLSYVEPFHYLQYHGLPLERLSPGEKGTLLLMFHLLIDPSEQPLILDQPDENLDNETIKNLLAPAIKEASTRRQVIIVTHNANVAVVADADQIIAAEMIDGRFNYRSGSIESTAMNQHVVDVLEGTWPAFGNRQAKYHPPKQWATG
ncbi:TrlF family AAA-like ATPase [Pseudonocardia sp. N23]|uniref:TrlF family AAA-like ATPase n=1 Tax=Pseudonocardia sp. N23 TaxID=1987376 RepID=UPI0035B68402